MPLEPHRGNLLTCPGRELVGVGALAVGGEAGQDSPRSNRDVVCVCANDRVRTIHRLCFMEPVDKVRGISFDSLS